MEAGIYDEKDALLNAMPDCIGDEEFLDPELRWHPYGHDAGVEDENEDKYGDFEPPDMRKVIHEEANTVHYNLHERLDLLLVNHPELYEGQFLKIHTCIDQTMTTHS